MKKYKLVVMGMLSLVMILVLSGCVAKTDFEKLQAENRVLEEKVLETDSDYNALDIEYTIIEELNGEQKEQLEELSIAIDVIRQETKTFGAIRDSLESEMDALQEVNDKIATQLEAVKINLDVTEKELSDIEEVYPLTGFNSIMQLEDWIRENSLNVTTDTVDELYRSALKIQEKGMRDGYLISVIYDEDDTDSEYGWIFNGAEVGGIFYVWDPETDEIYYYTNFLTR